MCVEVADDVIDAVLGGLGSEFVMADVSATEQKQIVRLRSCARIDHEHVMVQDLWRELVRRLRTEVVPAVTYQQREAVSLELVWACRDEVFVSDFYRYLYRGLVQRPPWNRIDVGLFFNSLTVDAMDKLTSGYAQLFGAIVQCVHAVTGLVGDSAMLRRGQRTVNGTPVDVGAACEFGRGPRGVEVVVHMDSCP